MLESPDTINPLQASDSSAESTSGHHKQKRSRNKKKVLSRNDVLTRFTSCGRCSLFLAAYRIDNDDQVIESAIAESDGEWLALPWNEALRRLIVKSYGCRLDSQVYFFESTCPECLGKFRYQEAQADEPSFIWFKI